jgi:hypothetical protein
MNKLKNILLIVSFLIFISIEINSEIYLNSLTCVASKPEFVELSCLHDETFMNISVNLKQSIKHILVIKIKFL